MDVQTTSPAESTIGSIAAAPSWSGVLQLLRENGSRIATWLLPFVLVLYLGLKGGGYEAIVRDEVGIAIWWIVMVAAAFGIMPTTALGRNGWIGLGLITAFTFWTALGIGWSSDAGASVTEFGRVAMYLGVFALVLAARNPGDMRRLVNGLAAGMAVIGALALLSRLHPSWFPTDDTAEALR